MNKVATLREALVASSTYLRESPESLHIFVKDGHVRSTLGRGLSFVYVHTVELVVTDYPGHPDSLVVPLLGWVKRHQPDLLQNPDKADAIKFEVEVLSGNTYDIAITLPLTESVKVVDADGQLEAHHTAEPLIEELDDFAWELYIKGVHVPWPPTEPLPIP